MDKIHLLDLTLAELEEHFLAHKIEKYRAAQVFRWIYQNSCFDLEQMTNLSKSLREKLQKLFYVQSSTKVKEHPTHDGTTKLALQLKDKNTIEAVYIPEKERFTVCISTQAGCPLDCQFCASAYAPYKRNLSAGEIIEQVLYLSQINPRQKITNIVLMGIGEPLMNPHVPKFLTMATAKWGGQFSPRRITLSTAGIVPKIYKLAENPVKVNLAVSLHATNDKQRHALMPKVAFSIEETIEAARYYFERTKRSITFEYILIAGVNDRKENALELAKLLRGFARKINLIPLNPVSFFPHMAPSETQIKKFVHYLRERNIPVTIRKRKGREAKAACGQLRLEVEAESS